MSSSVGKSKADKEQTQALIEAAKDNASRLRHCAINVERNEPLRFMLLEIAPNTSPPDHVCESSLRTKIHCSIGLCTWAEFMEGVYLRRTLLVAVDTNNWHELGFALDHLFNLNRCDTLVDTSTMPAEAWKVRVERLTDAAACTTVNCSCRTLGLATLAPDFLDVFLPCERMRDNICRRPPPPSPPPSPVTDDSTDQTDQEELADQMAPQPAVMSINSTDAESSTHDIVHTCVAPQQECVIQ